MTMHFGNVAMEQLKPGIRLKTNDWAGHERHMQYLTTVRGNLLTSYEGNRIGPGDEGIFTPESGFPASMLLLEPKSPFNYGSPVLHRVDYNPHATELPGFNLDTNA